MYEQSYYIVHYIRRKEEGKEETNNTDSTCTCTCIWQENREARARESLDELDAFQLIPDPIRHTGVTLSAYIHVHDEKA